MSEMTGKYLIRPFETDIWDTASPSLLMKLNMDAVIARAARDGLPRGRLFGELGAIWMLARLRLWLERPLRCGEELGISVSGRYPELATMRRVSRFYVGETPVGGADLAFLIVKRSSREIIRPSCAEYLWAVPPETGVLPPLRRLRPGEAMEYAGSRKVRFSRCDSNGHLSSAAYADLACDAAGYWSGAVRFPKSLRLDFRAECRPGERLSLYTGGGDGAFDCKGLSESGAISFLARLEYADAPVYS